MQSLLVFSALTILIPQPLNQLILFKLINHIAYHVDIMLISRDLKGYHPVTTSI